VTDDRIPFEYRTIRGNKPEKYDNTVFVWQVSQPAIPCGTPPLKEWDVRGDSENGGSVFDGLDVVHNSYLLGYAVGPDPKNACAVVFVPAKGGSDPLVVSPMVTMTWCLPKRVYFDYVLPVGSRPDEDRDWVGFWKDQISANLYVAPPDWFVPVRSHEAKGDGFLDNIPLEQGHFYTLGYFKGGHRDYNPIQTTLACATTMRYW
jgi:hypothetical protein